MVYLKSAIQFLTILPAGKTSEFDANKIIPYFPVVGLIIGILVSAFDLIAFYLWPGYLVSILDVMLLAILTGALHIDGLGDMADGLLGHRPKEKALLIMKDSRMGAMGLVTIIFALAVKCGAIASLNESRNFILVLVPIYSRSTMIFGMKFLPYGRPDGGTAFDFFKESVKPYYFITLIIPIVFSYFLGVKGVILLYGFIIITGVILYYYKRRMGCITGDMLGAMVEITESCLFLIVAAEGYL
ncbi:MAG: adenosylcobinamide-GDP ribazoletransferase [Proteobacteria bacterium]|nr:adenosylcobinamide-GDP ribazoletransferase [Pseudomonadota bacterium]